jgi:hypothetical protein
VQVHHAGDSLGQDEGRQAGLSIVGILSSLGHSTWPTLEISIFAVSTFDTYLLVNQLELQKGLAAFRAAGHAVE